MNDYNEKKYKVLNIDALYNIENKRLLDFYYAIGEDRLVLKFGRKRKYIIDNISIKSCCFHVLKGACIIDIFDIDNYLSYDTKDNIYLVNVEKIMIDKSIMFTQLAYKKYQQKLEYAIVNLNRDYVIHFSENAVFYEMDIQRAFSTLLTNIKFFPNQGKFDNINLKAISIFGDDYTKAYLAIRDMGNQIPFKNLEELIEQLFEIDASGVLWEHGNLIIRNYSKSEIYIIFQFDDREFKIEFDSKKCLRKDIITAIVSLMKADSFEEVRSKRAKLKLLGLPSGEEIDVE